MKHKLLGNTKHATGVFAVCILCATLSMLVLRLTVFSGFADTQTFPKEESPASAGQSNLDETEIPSSSGEPTFAINRKIYFSKPNAAGNIMFENPADNQFLMSVDIVLKETGKSVLYTGFVKPGEPVERKKLNVELEEGIYECEAEIAVYDPDTLEPQGTSTIDLELYIGQKP